MKKVVSDFIKTFGLETGYSGGQRILYIQKGERASEALREVRAKWPTLAFYVRITEEIPAEAKETVSAQHVSGSTVDEKLATSIVDSAMDTVFGPEPLAAEAVLTEVDSKQAAIELRAKVDAYLVQYQNNKNEKGFYTAAAKFLGTNSEYVRDRYRKLKAKGLVENTQTA